MSDHVVNGRAEWSFWGESGHVLQLRKRWDAAEHVLKSWLICLIVWNMGNARVARSSLFNHLSQIFYGYLLVASNVDNLAHSFSIIRQANYRFHRVRHKTKTSRLLTRAKNRERCTGKGLRHKIRQHHSITARLARPNGVEKPGDNYRQFLLLPVREGQKFIQRFRSSITPSTFGSWSQDQIRILAKRYSRAFPVDFRCGCNEHEFFLFVGGVQNQLSSVHIRLDCSYGALYDQAHPDRRCEMEDNIGFINHLIQKMPVLQAVEDVVELWRALQMTNVFNAPRREVVENEHFISLSEQCFRQMGSNEPRSSGDQSAHENLLMTLKKVFRRLPGSTTVLFFLVTVRVGIVSVRVIVIRRP